MQRRFDWHFQSSAASAGICLGSRNHLSGNVLSETRTTGLIRISGVWLLFCLNTFFFLHQLSAVKGTMAIFKCLTHYKSSVFQQRRCDSCQGADAQISVEICCKSHHKMVRGVHNASGTCNLPLAWNRLTSRALSLIPPSGTFSPFCWQTGQFESQMCLEKEESRTDVLCSMCGIGLRAGASLRSPGEAISALIAWRWVCSIPPRSRILSANTWPRQPHTANTHAGVWLPSSLLHLHTLWTRASHLENANRRRDGILLQFRNKITCRSTQNTFSTPVKGFFPPFGLLTAESQQLSLKQEIYKCCFEA